MKKQLLALLAVAVVATSANAAGKIGDIDVSGYVDVYSALNLNTPAAMGVPLHLFEGNEIAALNRSEVVFESSAFRVDLGYGIADNTVNAAGGGTTGSLLNLQQAFVKVPVGKSLMLNVGKFVTHMGFEVIESKDNWLYTRGLLFQYAIPYYHTGAKAIYTINDKWSAHISLVDGWNNVTTVERRVAACAQVVGNLFGISTVLNYVTGPQTTVGSQADLTDLVLMYDLSNAISLGFNYDSGFSRQTAAGVNNGYNASAYYLKYSFVPNGANIALRYENFNDPNAAIVALGTATNITSTTVGFNAPLNANTLWRIEYRTDSANNGNQFSNSTGTNKAASQSTITTAISASF